MGSMRSMLDRLLHYSKLENGNEVQISNSTNNITRGYDLHSDKDKASRMIDEHRGVNLLTRKHDKSTMELETYKKILESFNSSAPIHERG